MSRTPILRDRGAITVLDVSNRSTRDTASGLINREINFWQAKPRGLRTVTTVDGRPIAMGGPQP